MIQNTQNSLSKEHLIFKLNTPMYIVVKLSYNISHKELYRKIILQKWTAIL